MSSRRLVEFQNSRNFAHTILEVSVLILTRMYPTPRSDFAYFFFFSHFIALLNFREKKESAFESPRLLIYSDSGEKTEREER